MKTNEQIEEEDILWREQMHDAEFDYLDMQINRTEKIKQKGRDKVLTKKNAAEGPTKEEQQKILKEQNRLKQLRIQEKKRLKEEEAEQLKEQQMHNERLQMDKRMLAEFNKTTEEEKKNADECDWEDLY